MLSAVILQMTSVIVSPAIVDNDMLFATTTHQYNDKLTTDSAISTDTYDNRHQAMHYIMFCEKLLARQSPHFSFLWLNRYLLPMIGQCVIWMSYLNHLIMFCKWHHFKSLLFPKSSFYGQVENAESTEFRGIFVNPKIFRKLKKMWNSTFSTCPSSRAENVEST